jgi:hypothetical protein
MKVRHLVLALAFALPLPALAGQCPALMKKFDEILATNPKMDPVVLEEAKKAREAGEKFHKEGEHGKSVDELRQALFLMGE